MTQPPITLAVCLPFTANAYNRDNLTLNAET